LDNVLSTNQKGATAETAIVHAAVKLGVNVYSPQMEGGRYDMIFDLGERLLRVQCKWAPRHGDVIVIRCYSCRRNREGLLRRVYAEGEIDAFAAYCEDVDRCYLLPFEQFVGRNQVLLRLAACKNNQAQGINWAKDFEFAATLGRLGAIAQLGERRHGMAEVAGSIPAGSTL
jgi:PD-(D/E)XK nuclease superfamily protein